MLFSEFCSYSTLSISSTISVKCFLYLCISCTFPVCRIPEIISVAIPMKATFFITYLMVDGWAGMAGEILMLKPLIIYHLKNIFLVKTEKDRQEAMDAGSLGFNTSEPRMQLYFLLGLVNAAVTPILLPFIVIFFSFSYVVFRHQVRIPSFWFVTESYIKLFLSPHVG